MILTLVEVCEGCSSYACSTNYGTKFAQKIYKTHKPTNAGFPKRFRALQMQLWIDQAKNKLMDIIVQTKEDYTNISVRVAFVG